MALYKPTLYMFPASGKTVPGGHLQMIATGGTGSGYSFSMDTSRSGGTINGAGLYVAGPTAGTTDQLRVHDSDNSSFVQDVTVLTTDAPTLGSIRNEVKQRTDLVNSSFILDPEWNQYINQSVLSLYDMLTVAYGNQYNVAPPYLYLMDGATERYLLPPDHYKFLGLDVQVSNTTSGWMNVPKFNFGERNKFMVPYQVFYGIRTNLHYRVVGNKIWVLPIAAAGQYLRAHYVPKLSRLALDTDVVDGVNGWEEYVTVDVAIKALTKRQQDASTFQQQKMEMSQRIGEIAADRDIGTASTVQDVRAEEDDFNRGGSGGPF